MKTRSELSPTSWHPGILTAAIVSISVAACATTGGREFIPSEGELPALEAQLGRETDNSQLMVQLGAGYLEAGRPEDARSVLERARDLEPGNDAATLFLGLTYEDLGRLADARSVYGEYLELGDGTPLRSEVGARLVIVRRRELEQSLSAALLQEEQLDVAEVDSAAVAVFPFLYRGLNPQYDPLGRALSAMLITDLARTDRLRVLERVEVQVLMDEMALAETSVMDPATAARSGLLLGAANVIQGAIGGSDSLLTVQAAVVEVGRGAPDGTPDVSDEDEAQRLFAMEKRIALGLYETLGIELTAAERELVAQRWTDNLQALLAFGRGLQAEDLGDYALAARHYRAAAQLDPGFEEAGAQAASADATATATGTSTAELAADAADQLLTDIGYTQFFDLAESLEGAQRLVPTPERRDPVSEVTGTEGFRPRTFVNITLRRPRGGR